MKLPKEPARFCVLAFPLCKAKASLANVQEPTEDEEPFDLFKAAFLTCWSSF